MHSSEELLDVFDSNGELLGKSKPRAQVHKTGDWHKTVHVWIISSQGELLLQKRSESKESHPGLWDISCAGHIKSGQTSTDAAIKEAREELGLFLKEKDIELLFSVKNQSVEHQGAFIDNEISDVYLVCRDIDNSNLLLQASEVSAVRWIHYKKLKERLTINPNEYVPHDEEYEKLFEVLHRRHK